MANRFEKRRGESGETKEFREVNAEMLTELFNSDRFLKNAKLIHDMSVQMHEEAGFAVGRNLKTGKLTMGKAVHASQTDIFLEQVGSGMYDMPSVSLGKKFVDLEKEGKAVNLFDLHTHPSNTVQPSKPDLTALVSSRGLSIGEKGVDFYPIRAIMAVPASRSHTAVEVLLMQEKRSVAYRDGRAGGAVADYVENTLAQSGRERDGRTIADTVNSSFAVQAEFISRRRDPATGLLTHTLTQNELQEKMARFAYTPRRVQSDYDKFRAK